MKVLIVYGTAEGQTRKICDFIKSGIEASGNTVQMNDASDSPPAPDHFDAVILAGSVHMSHYQSSIEWYMHEYASLLNGKQTCFVSVSLSALATDEKSLQELHELTNKTLEKAGWIPNHVEYVAGALLYTEYNFMKRFIMRLIAGQSGRDTDTSRDYEYTDWDRLSEFTEEFVTARMEEVQKN